MGVVKQLGGVIDVVQKTFEFRNIPEAKVPLEVVAGHLRLDLKPKHASSLQRHRCGNRHVMDRRRHFNRVQKE